MAAYDVNISWIDRAKPTGYRQYSRHEVYQ
jgi:hypothetical protein